MPPLSLQDFSAAMKNYIQTLNGNNAAIEAAVNALQAQVLASVGPGAELILDLFDEDGLVGAASYVLDLETYAGGAEITIGRRPGPNGGEADESVAWVTVGGDKTRVRLVGDLVLDAEPITAGLPKTIYVGIPSDGTPQLFEDTATPNVLYAYSMTWNGFELTAFKRLCPILAGGSLIKAMAGAPQVLKKDDGETDWLSDVESKTGIVLPGAVDDNGVFDGAMEVLGFILHADTPGDDGFHCPVGEESILKLRVAVGAGEYWTDDIDVDLSLVPDDYFIPLAAGVGSDRFVTEITRFNLERISIGSDIVSARAFSWGVVVRPIFGLAAPKSGVDLV